MRFVENLDTLEQLFEKHKIDNRNIQDFRQTVDECIARQVGATCRHVYWLIAGRSVA